MKKAAAIFAFLILCGGISNAQDVVTPPLLTPSQMLEQIKGGLFPVFKYVEAEKTSDELKDAWGQKLQDLAQNPDQLRAIYAEFNLRTQSAKKLTPDTEFSSFNENSSLDSPFKDFETAKWLLADKQGNPTQFAQFQKRLKDFENRFSKGE